MRTKITSLVLLCLFTILLFPAMASAHVLVTDTKGTTGAILHITPNDDPVAGGTAGIYFDVKTKEDLGQAALHLTIANESGGINESVLVSGKNNNVAGAFIFPTRGLYYMTLTIGQKAGGPKITPLVFRYSIRITGSTAGRDPKPVIPVWVTFGLIMSVWGLAASVLVFIMRRTKIFRQSK